MPLIVNTDNAFSLTGDFKDLCQTSPCVLGPPVASILAAAASVEAGPCEAPVRR